MSSLSMLVQLSDLHLYSGEGSDAPAERLGRVVRQVAKLRPPADAVLISGDLADVPSRAAYEQVHDLLSTLGVPLHAIPGNHDDRDLLRAQFAPDAGDPGAPVTFAVECGALRLIGCDSVRPGEDGGSLGPQQIDWLNRVLSEQPGQPTLLALHHPPVLTGVRVMDAIGLDREDSLALEALLERHPQVQALACGHVHTAMATGFAGRPLLICPSTNSALRLDLREREGLPFGFDRQPLGFTVHALVDGRLVSHIQALTQE